MPEETWGEYMERMVNTPGYVVIPPLPPGAVEDEDEDDGDDE